MQRGRTDARTLQVGLGWVPRPISPPPPPLLPVYRQHMPPCALPCPVLCYEELLDAQLTQLPGFRWTDVDEEAACGLCYTSGTTGNPKGVL